MLANYYRLDHLATRMRRNSESLLVLASAESRRRRTKATDVDDVVRAAIGEVEDYRRIDVLNLDHLQVRGAVVADISHLLAELLDNASSFSPPESRVTVSGRYAGEHYLISISDEGVGIGPDRLEQLNDILIHPPIVGLSVEPTLGMSVVSLLANKHGVQVRLVPSSPGLLVEVVLPATLYGPIDATGLLGAEPAANGHATAGARQAHGLGRDAGARRHISLRKSCLPNRRPHHSSRSSRPVPTFDVDVPSQTDTMFDDAKASELQAEATGDSPIVERHAARRRADVRARMVDRAGMGTHDRADGRAGSGRRRGARGAGTELTELGRDRDSRLPSRTIA